MSKEIINSGNNEKVHSQFENELFLRYLNYFTNLKIEYTEKLKKDFFDKKNNILKIPKNPNFLEVQKIINFLDELIEYNLGITAKKRLEQKKSQIKRLGLKTKNSIENSLLIESLYESGKKLVLETMQAPNSDKLLKNVLDLNNLSKTFEKLNLFKQQEIVRNIIFTLLEYKKANSIEGGIPMIFLQNKKLYCVGHSYLLDVIFEKLKIKHYIATGSVIVNKNGERELHSLPVVKLKNNFYVVDTGTADLEKINSNINWNKNIFDLRNKKETLFPGAYFSFGNPETEIIAQNIFNLSLDEKNLEKKKKLLNYGLKLSPNNIVIKTELKKLKNGK